MIVCSSLTHSSNASSRTALLFQDVPEVSNAAISTLIYAVSLILPVFSRCYLQEATGSNNGCKEEKIVMQLFNQLVLRIWKDKRGQDLIEYALMAGFVAVAAGAVMPGVSTNISTIFSKVASVMTEAAN